MQGPAVRLRAEDPLRIQENPCVRKGEVMADSNKAAADKAKKARTKKKGSWSKGLKTEWDKIVWTDRKTLLKQTGSVVGPYTMKKLDKAGVGKKPAFMMSMVGDYKKYLDL